MPKKFRGENTKASEARARKAAAVNEEADRKKKEADDAYWADDDKQLAKKSQRKVAFIFFEICSTTKGQNYHLPPRS